MKKIKLFDAVLLFASLALLIMWVDQVVYKKVDMKDSYFFLMFSLGGFLYYVYRKGNYNSKENDQKKKKK